MADAAIDYDEIDYKETKKPHLKLHKWTYKDYKNWELKPGERIELIYGNVYAMAAPSLAHQRVSMTLSGALYIFFKGKTCEPFAAPIDVRLFYKEDESDDTVVQPDLIVVCDPNKLGKEGCRGAPDLIIEILSPSNTATEMSRKKNLYLAAGVSEFWIVDPELKQIEVNRIEKGRYMPYLFCMGDTLDSFKFTDFKLPIDTIFPE